MTLSESDVPGGDRSRVRITTYVWIQCADAGWQALVPSTRVNSEIPKLPSIVLSKSDVIAPEKSDHRSMPSPSTTRGIRGKPKNKVSRGKSSPDRSASPRVRDPRSPSSSWAASLRDRLDETTSAPSDSPVRNFLDINRRKLAEPSRSTKVSLLAQASKQLEESELISASLAERLKHIHAKLNV